MDLRGKRVVVIGLGISGMEASKLLHDQGARVTVRDNATTGKVAERADALRRLGMRVELGREVRTDADFDLAVLSPGINPAAPIVETLHQAGLPMFGELELAYRFCECPIVAITGTNGKTTTTELVEALLVAGGKRALASGNIGTAFSTAVRSSADLDVMVLEVSSFQLENIVDFRPRISVHLNLTPDHLDRYKTMEEYAYAKRQIFRNQTVDDYAVLNAAMVVPGVLAQQVTFSAQGRPADYQLIDGWLVARGEQVLEQSRTHLIGEHNAENMLAALAVADLYEIPREASIRALCAYNPLPHRLEKVGEVDGAVYLNDSKATNIDALEKALIAMRTPVVLIAGGKDKGLDFTGLRPLLREKARAIVLIGQMAEKMEAAWSSAVSCHRCETLAEAVKQAHLLAHRGDTVLFSPGCSSYDMFKSFEDRGDQFRALVQALAPKTTS
jgi:UDP-N-acetylmuramoylalanine--D-glutamate ligase